MKHPSNRAERLRLKKLKYEEKKAEASHLRRKLQEQIKDQESRDELRRAQGHSSVDVKPQGLD